MAGAHTTFSLDPVPEIHLARAPQEKVLTQVQFSITPDLISDEGEWSFATKLSRYPIRWSSQSFIVTVNPEDASVENKLAAHRIFTDPTQSWVVTVIETPTGLKTTAYSSRADFCVRVLEVFEAVASVATPPIIARVGLRYIDRVRDSADLGRLDECVKPQLRVLDGAVENPLVVEYSVSDTLIRIADDERLKVRSGELHAAAAFDPVLAPIPERLWVLDFDIFTSQGGFAFDQAAFDVWIHRYGEHICSFFRWPTTDEFHRAFHDEEKLTSEDIL